MSEMNHGSLESYIPALGLETNSVNTWVWKLLEDINLTSFKKYDSQGIYKKSKRALIHLPLHDKS